MMFTSNGYRNSIKLAPILNDFKRSEFSGSCLVTRVKRYPIFLIPFYDDLDLKKSLSMHVC